MPSRPYAHHRSLARSAIIASLGVACVASLGMALHSSPASAQIAVYDPSNFSQNVLTAARTLQQVNNQIRSLQNEATSLINQARNLSKISFPELQAITRTLREIDQLMGQAQAIEFQVASTERQFRSLFPNGAGPLLTGRAQMAAAQARMDASVAAFRQTMTVQSQIAQTVQVDAETLSGIVARSQGAEGALQVGQATNQLLALTAKQQFQIQQLMAAQYRAEAIEQARRAQAQADAHAATTRFLGSGSAYTPR
ncbi:P-type conjugative transfer protein TrbJ [Sphingomonas qomolangmaensis]|uniref:P-type conjugative transfer protein TrbJ n=1 Tax=Sphingomonas qomolangmaensis TaxID=2918765 RepID=A0ABY5L8B4_9SPHN|nr:P-type conjugative transfer protein TrbJ [Sphingomonas qomolangmaensis]UUL82401.1 P-type conjugative transfer protein TrbJ [Sphingomonas qomolangmaensis]